MHSYIPYVDVRRDDDHFPFGSAMSHHIYQNHDGNWPPVDPALYNSQLEQQQKLLSPDYSIYQTPNSYHIPPLHISENFSHALSTPGWNASLDSFRDMRYNSPNGHFGGSLSESSSDYAVSPEAVRQQMSYASNRYLSPSAESHFTPQTWSEAASFMLTPTSTPAGTQTPLIAMKELEFPGNPEFQLEIPDDDLRAQLPVNNPEELDISDSIATLTTSSQANTSLSAPSPYDTDSSVSSPARDHDSDSDFDPRSKASKTNAGSKQLAIRSPRRASSSSYTTLDTNNRIHKASNSRSTQNKEKTKSRTLQPLNNSSESTLISKLPKSFPCAFHAFGCSSTFANKNEWKRHVTSQHLQLGFYRCDLGSCNPDNALSQPRQSQNPTRGRGHNKRRSISHGLVHAPEFDEEVKIYNDFNRKDLFTQHCRRMHGPLRHLEDDTTQTNQAINARLRAQGRKSISTGKPMSTKDDEAAFEEELEAIRARCWTPRRYAPSRSTCGFCSKVFETCSGPTSDGKAEERAWEERMEHIGRHYERDGACVENERIDRSLLEWGLNQGVLYEADGAGCGVWLIGYELPNSKQAEEEKRDGLRRRGPRRKVSLPITSRVGSNVSVSKNTSAAIDESDEDAMGEDE